MNRYSLIFVLLMASSLAVHSPSPETTGTSSRTANEKSGPARIPAQLKSAEAGVAGIEAKNPSLEGPLQVIHRFLSNISSAPQPENEVKVLFATLPHPIETHLASAFDHNIDALQSGIQAAGYVYDSSFIPWAKHEARETFDDDEREKASKRDQDALPGILLFRQSSGDAATYSQGLIVILFSEKPTQGIAIDQVPNALSLLSLSGIKFTGPLRILGPNYTGSLASLVATVRILHNANPDKEVRIRSGSVSGGDTAASTMGKIADQLPGTSIDFGSAQPDNLYWTTAALETLERIGICQGSVATLSENESMYGHITLLDSKRQRRQTGRLCRDKSTDTKDQPAGMWSLSFPRDISSLRAGYQQQGILQSRSLTQPWNKVLELSGDDESEGDTVKSFGGSATIAAQESVLFGISEFLKKHAIRAVIIVATNEEDRYFLSEFIHAHNSDVRVVVIGATRVFMRGATAEFRGDLLVDDLPQLPRLHDWTGGNQDFPAYVFANDTSQGTFFAAIDLLAKDQKLHQWYPEYSEPDWSGNSGNRYPPMYVVALGGNLTWPVSVSKLPQLQKGEDGRWNVEMPFTLLGNTPKKALNPAPNPRPIRVPLTWKILFCFLILCTAVYCVCFLFANSVAHSLFASFEPSIGWRFWLFKVAIPAALFGAVFRLLSWTNEMPFSISPSALSWGQAAETMTVLAPLAIALAAIGKMVVGGVPRWNAWMLFCLPPVIFHTLTYFTSGYSDSSPFAKLDVGSVLTHYREMHWESGLSLVPTTILFLFALFVWTTQAGNGAAILEGVSILPEYPDNERVSNARAKAILSVARPFPLSRRAKWLWSLWGVVSACVVIAHFYFRPFERITTLEPLAITRLLLMMSTSIVILLLLDLLQFLWLWTELRGLLKSLDRQIFKRSFIPIKNFHWKSLWSFTGTSFSDRAEIEGAQIDCILELALKHRIPSFLRHARILKRLRSRYAKANVAWLSPHKRRRNRALFYNLVQAAGNHAAVLVEGQRYSLPPITSPPTKPNEGDGGRFKDEEDELARLPEWQQSAEKLLCLIYISFIQTIIARLRTLLVSIASLFSLATLGFAIYPFEPLSPLLFSGLILIVMIAGAFYKVFSEMDTDRTLSRIVDGDDRKLEKGFYFKMAESLALPLLTLGSSFLPGGAGRLLEIVQTLFGHAD